MIDAALLGSASSRCIHFAMPTEFDAVRDELAAAGVRVVEAPGGRSKTELLSRLSEALALPPYFGGNWDALEECLTDLEVTSLVIAVRNAKVLWNAAPRAAGTLIEVWQSAASVQREDGAAMHLVFVW